MAKKKKVKGQKELSDDFALEQSVAPTVTKKKKKKVTKKKKARSKKKAQSSEVLSYRHDEKRKNNPHVGMVDTASDHDEAKKTWAYDPHIDPALQFDSSRAIVEKLIDEALASGDQKTMKAALKQLKRMQEPYLNWAGKAENTSFDVDTVSLHVHERIDPATILAGLQKRIKDSKGKEEHKYQSDLFQAPFENLPLRDAIDFYKHDKDWANRLIAGDSLLVMNSLLQKEGMAGRVQMIFLDPPYGIKYKSNFQPFVNKMDVVDRKDEDLSQEPEMIKAFRDTWELGVHSFLTYLRDRLFLAEQLLSESGSIFIQISDENVHLVRTMMDDIFGKENFVSQITFRKKLMPLGSKTLENMSDYLIWYAKDKTKLKYHQLYKLTKPDPKARWTGLELEDGRKRTITSNEKKTIASLSGTSKIFTTVPQIAPSYSEKSVFNFKFMGDVYSPSSNSSWVTTVDKMERLNFCNRLFVESDHPRFVLYHDDFGYSKITNPWTDTPPAQSKIYAVQTSAKVLERCILMTTEPGDLVFDPTCGSGTTAYAAERLGRRWITCDTSRVSVTLAKQRLMTASYDYYRLKYPQEGLKSGFVYKNLSRISLKSIANNKDIDEIYKSLHPVILEALNELNRTLINSNILFVVNVGCRKGQSINFNTNKKEIITIPSSESVNANYLLEWEIPFDFPDDWPEKARTTFDAFHVARIAMQKKMDASIASHAGQEVLYDKPEISKNKLRITGPFTVEAVPFATVLGLDEADQPKEADVAVARSGATSRQSQWRSELLKAGIRGKGKQKVELIDLEPLPDTKYIHAVGTVKDTGDKVAVSFGPEYAALEQRQVEIAMREASELFPLPKMLVFCAFTFDPEAAKDIDSIKGINALKVQMNTDLLTEDLKKARSSNESFWLMGQPDVKVKKLKDDTYEVEVHGFDYFDTKTGELKSGGKKNIAMWALDTNYDNRSLFPQQVFFPMAGAKDGWNKLKKDIKAELDESLLDQFHGTVSIPFTKGDHECIAIKIVDDRGIESLKVINLD